MPDEEGWNMFLDLCREANETLCLEQLFSLLLTIEEREHLASRMLIIKALVNEKMSQREISDKMKVSISQITRGSNALKIINNDLLKFLKDYARNCGEEEQ